VKIKGKIIVIFRVIDNAGLDKAVIYVQTAGKRIIYLGGDKRREIEEVFEIGDLLRLIHGGYDVRVNVTDINGNWATGKTHIDSALQTLKKGLSALLDMIVAALKVIAKVASMLLDVIKKIIRNMMKPIIEPIRKSILKFISQLDCQMTIIQQYIQTHDNNRNNASQNAELPSLYSVLVFTLLGASFPLALMGLVQVLIIIQNIITAFSYMSGPAAVGISRVITSRLNEVIKIGISNIMNNFMEIYKGFMGGLLIGFVADWLKSNYDLPYSVIVFLSMFELFFTKAYTNSISLKKAMFKFYKDSIGLFLSLLGIVITLYINYFSSKNKLYMLTISIILNLIGFGIALFTEDGGDKYWTLSYLEEGVCAGLLALSLYTFLMYIN